LKQVINLLQHRTKLMAPSSSPDVVDTFAQRYPEIANAVGPHWLKQRARERPELCDFPLGRWLYIAGADQGLDLIEQALSLLQDQPLIADRRRRLRRDAAGFEETRVELLVAAWLKSHGYDFAFQSAGPDLTVTLAEGITLPMEVTSPRRTALWHDLFERLGLLAHRFGVEIRIDSDGAQVLAGENRVTNARPLIDHLVALLTSPVADGQVLEIHRPEFGLTLEIDRSEFPTAYHPTTAGTITAYTAFRYVIGAARAKESQAFPDRANALVIGTSRLPSTEWEWFRDQLRWSQEFVESLDWTSVPGCFKYLMLFSPSLVSLEPRECLLVTNPNSPFDAPEGIEDFVGRLFPQPLVDPTRPPFFRRPY
jgi:hypothetical protein